MRKTFTFLLASMFFLPSSFGQSNGLHFDGVNDYVTIPERAGVLTGSAFTFETWVKPTAAFTGNGPVFHKANAAYDQALDVYFFPYNANGALEIDFWINSSVYFITYPLSASWINAWHHVAITYNGSSLQLFVDGNPASSTPASGSLSATGTQTNLGYIDVNNPGYFNGTLDELRIWNVPRTQAQIQAAMNTEIPAGTAGLTANYRFNQGTVNGNNTAITTAVDYTAANNGTLVNFARNGTTSNFVLGYPSLTVLALKDASFTATKKESGVLLNWKSTPSQESFVFAVERSANGIDFSSLATLRVPAAATETAQSYNDPAPPSPVAYYRIKSTNADGRVAYSKTLAVSIGKTVGGLQVYPNPASSVIQLQVPKGIALVEVKDLGGRTVQSMQITSHGGAVYTTMDVSKLANGTYLITAGDNASLLIKQ